MRARIALEECGLAYTFHPVDLTKGEQKTPSFLSMNPNGQIPRDRRPRTKGPGGSGDRCRNRSPAAACHCRRESGKFLPKDPARAPAFWQALLFRGERHSTMVTAILTLSRNNKESATGGPCARARSLQDDVEELSVTSCGDTRLGMQRYRRPRDEVTIARLRPLRVRSAA